jgi:hypothetical protein
MEEKVKNAGSAKQSNAAGTLTLSINTLNFIKSMSMLEKTFNQFQGSLDAMYGDSSIADAMGRNFTEKYMALKEVVRELMIDEMENDLHEGGLL